MTQGFANWYLVNSTNGVDQWCYMFNYITFTPILQLVFKWIYILKIQHSTKKPHIMRSHKYYEISQITFFCLNVLLIIIFHEVHNIHFKMITCYTFYISVYLKPLWYTYILKVSILRNLKTGSGTGLSTVLFIAQFKFFVMKSKLCYWNTHI